MIRLSADLPGTMGGPLFPPLVNVSNVPMSNLASFNEPLWQNWHLLAKIGSISFSYNTGSCRSILITSIGSTFSRGFFSWAPARPGSRSVIPHRRKNRIASSPELVLVPGIFLSFSTSLHNVYVELGLVDKWQIVGDRRRGADNEVLDVTRRCISGSSENNFRLVFTCWDCDDLRSDGLHLGRQNQLHFEFAGIVVHTCHLDHEFGLGADLQRCIRSIHAERGYLARQHCDGQGCRRLDHVYIGLLWGHRVFVVRH